MYKYVESISSLTLALVRGLDGLHELKKSSFTPSSVAYERLLKTMNMPIEHLGPRGQTAKVGIEDVVNKLYVSLAASSTVNAIVRVLWLPAFNRLVIRSDFLGGALSGFILSLQALASLTTSILVSRALIPTAFKSLTVTPSILIGLQAITSTSVVDLTKTLVFEGLQKMEVLESVKTSNL